MNLSYAIVPNLAKRDTLFIHGNLASARWWRPTVDEWRSSGSVGEGRLILTDLRGCGINQEWPPDQIFTLKDLANDCFQILSDLKTDKIDIVGHSLGGLIALQMMVMSPERFHKAFLLSPVGAKGVVFDASMYDVFKQMAENPELTRTVILSTIENQESLDPHFKDQISDDAFKAVKGTGSSVLEMLKNVDISNELRHCQIPTMIAHGKKDQIIPVEDSLNLKQIMPTVELLIPEAVGHCWNIENPPAFTKCLRGWLN